MAGIKASFRGIDLILEEGMNVRVLLFPDGDDPDSYSKKVTNEEFKEFIKWKRTKLQDLIHLNFWLRSFSTSNKADQFRLFHFYLIGKELNNWEQVDISFSKLVTSKEEFKILFEIICSIPSLKPTKEDFQQTDGLH